MFGEKNWSSKASHTVLNNTEIALLPATPALAKRSRKVEQSQILTTSLYKKLLFDATAKANMKQQKLHEENRQYKRHLKEERV